MTAADRAVAVDRLNRLGHALGEMLAGAFLGGFVAMIPCVPLVLFVTVPGESWPWWLNAAYFGPIAAGALWGLSSALEHERQRGEGGR